MERAESSELDESRSEEASAPPSDLEWVEGRRQAPARRAAVTGFGAIARVTAGRHCVTDSPAPAQHAAEADGPEG